jgi:6-phosphogluconolactonase
MDDIKITRDALDLAKQAANHFISLSQAAVQNQKQFTVVLSGGSTPRGMYSLLASENFRRRVEWEKVYIFWGDERVVPPNHPDSNYLLASQTLLDQVQLPAKNIHRIHGELDPKEAAKQYEQELTSFFTPTPGGIPQFDLVLLGLGEDGHTASLFAGTNALTEQTRWVAENYIHKLNEWRITLTPPIINASKNVIFLVSGERKAKALRGVLVESQRAEKFPAQMIQPKVGEMMWFIDKSAAALLQRPPNTKTS